MSNDCAHSDRVVALEVEVDGLKEDLKSILKEVRDISGQLTKYRGFIGGIAFVATSVPVIWALTKDWFMRHWS